jgi:hypothetical protein
VTVTEAMRARLGQITAVTALVGTRIYDVKTPQAGAFPRIRLQRVSEVEFMHLRGSANVFRARVQVDAIAQEKSGVDALGSARAVDAALHGPGDGSALGGWQGEIGSPPFRVWMVKPIDVREMYDAEALTQFKVMRDYEVWFSE